MPIRESEKHLYPKDWPERSALARFKAGNRCQECGLPNGLVGGRDKDGKWYDALPVEDEGHARLYWPPLGHLGRCTLGKCLKIIRIVLTVGHKDHHPENCAPSNLRVWCQQCHLRFDAKEKAKNLKARRRAARAVGEMFP